MPSLDDVGRELALERLARTQRVTGRELVGVDVAALEHILLHGQRPALVIGRGEVDLRRQLLLREARMSMCHAPA